MEQIFCKDIVLLICDFVNNDKYIIYFLSTCKYFHKLKDKIKYRTRVPIEKINHLWYRDCFSDLVVKITKYKNKGCTEHLPRGTNKLVLMNHRGNLDCIANSNITHLYLELGCRISTKNLKLPSTLFHLTWNISKNQCFPSNVPSSLKELVVSNYNYQSLVIPDSITSLVIDKKCSTIFITLPNTLEKLVMRRDIQIYHYPNSLRYLELDYDLYWTPISIPCTLYQLTIGKNCGFVNFMNKISSPVNIEVLVLHHTAL